MATRGYFATGTVAPISPAVDPQWERTATGFARHLATLVHDGSALADQASLHGSVATDQTCWHQWLIGPMTFQRTVGGVFSAVVRCQELLGTEDACPAYSLRAVSNDGLTVRGTLKLHHDASILEMNVGAPDTRLVDAEVLTPTLVQVGDWLVLEMGVHGVTPSNTNNILYRWGAPAGTDFARAAGLTTDLIPWFEFSDDLFLDPAAFPDEEDL